MLRKSKILILGARGMLGTGLAQEFAGNNEFYPHTLQSVGVYLWDRGEIDVTSEKQVKDKISYLKPEVVINATGYTDVDGAEDNQEMAFKVNAEAVKFITVACEQISARLVHFSTEYVFDGTDKNGYVEESIVKPLNIYGQSKAAGEKYVLAYSLGYLIRTSWLYGHAPQKGKPRGLNFIDTVQKLATEKPEVKIVNDQFGKPTYTKDLAKSVRELLIGSYQPGIYHLVNENVCSWYDLAKEIFKLKNVKTPLSPISSSEYPTKAKRPQYAVLLNIKLPPLRNWQEALKDYLNL
ncbi:MAG: dTDP-4-dehydrorhamnose reductase [Patescibacteria group bacterium]